MTDRTEVTQTAGRISKAFLAPAAARTAQTVAGISCMEAVFKTTNVHRSSFALSSSPLSSNAARIPAGVAALPSPKKFADTLRASASSAPFFFRR
jgi:hypothetical protein